MVPRTVYNAALRLRKRDDKDSVGKNSLAIDLSGGHGPKQAIDTLADIRIILEEVLRDKPNSPFGDAA